MHEDIRLVRARIVISGEVQGVNFRAAARTVGRAQGIFGWVRNRPDGSVEALVEGDQAAMQAFIDWCHRGPPAARVATVQVAWEPYQGEFDGFVVRG